VSRLGNPLVNEVVIPAGLKDAFNSLPPVKDLTIPQVVQRITSPEVPKLIEAIYKIPRPQEPRNDLVEIFGTGITTKANGPIKVDLNSQLNNADVNPQRFTACEELRLNMGVPVAPQPNRLGVLGGDTQGFPNGRRLTDDVVDIELQALEGAAQTGKLVDALAAGDKVDANDNAFGATFPYVALPNTNAVNQGGGSSGGAGTGAAPGTGTDNGTGTATDPHDGDMSASPDPSLSPAAGSASSWSDWPPMAVAGVSIAVFAVVAALVTLYLLGWRRRQQQAAAAAGPTEEI